MEKCCTTAACKVCTVYSSTQAKARSSRLRTRANLLASCPMWGSSRAEARVGLHKWRKNWLANVSSNNLNRLEWLDHHPSMISLQMLKSRHLKTSECKMLPTTTTSRLNSMKVSKAAQPLSYLTITQLDQSQLFWTDLMTMLRRVDITTELWPSKSRWSPTIRSMPRARMLAT